MRNSLLAILLFITLSCSAKKERVVLFETTYGNITVKLYNETPKHRDNFVKLAKKGYFDNLLFHRTINTFMIQGGDPDSKNAEAGKQLGNGGPDYEIDAEFTEGLYHKKGALAAAREGDDVNPLKKSSASQFYMVQGKVFRKGELDTFRIKRNQRKKHELTQKIYQTKYNEYTKRGELINGYDLDSIIKAELTTIWSKTDTLFFNEKQIELYTTVGGTPHLDRNYTVFGEIIKGLEIVDSIAKVKTDRYDRPINDVIIKKVVVIK